MSNYYTQSSFKINCTSEQAKMAETAITFITEADIEDGEALLSKPLSLCTLQEKLILAILERHPEFNVQEPAFSECGSNYLLELSCEADESGLAIFHDDTLNVDHAAAVTQAMLSVFDLPQMVRIGAAYLCDRKVADAFGGMMLVVTKDTMESLDTQDFAEIMETAHDGEMQHAVCRVAFLHGECSYESSYMLACKVTEKAEDVALSHLASLSATAEHVDGYVCLNEEDNIGVSLVEVMSLNAYDFALYSKNIPALDALRKYA